MRNSFNLLLVALACFDNIYLFGGILEAVHRVFGVASKAHVVLFPYLLYPVHAIGMTGSVLLTVAIALERCDSVACFGGKRPKIVVCSATCNRQ